MNPINYITTLVKPESASESASRAYDFDLIGRYFHNNARQEAAFQLIDEQTAADLDLDPVFEQIDRTTSKVGQQYLYARFRTLRGEEDSKKFGRSTDWFRDNPACADRCSVYLKRQANDDAYDLQNLIFDTPVRVRHIGLVYLFSLLSAASLLLSLLHPLFLLLFASLFAANLYIHYSNKLNLSLYSSAVKQLSRALQTARNLAAEEFPGSDTASLVIEEVSLVERRSRIIGTQGDSSGELLAIAWLLLELVKIAFNIEVILFHRFIGSITARRDAIHDLFRFIGENDAAISVMRLRAERTTCRPQFTDGKYLLCEAVTHPLIERCVPNTLVLDGTGLLLTGSNMSGKTTFIRTIMLNALLAETIDCCFATAYTAPYMKLHSTIRIADNVTEGASYYLQEVTAVKRQLDAAQGDTPCLFILDELFKGTNTTERIAAGKAVLKYLNAGPHIVLIATHDIELATLLRNDGYELYHFREEVDEGSLVFDYQLHTGPLATRNAIRILELYDYPPEVIAEAYDTQQKLLDKSL